MGFHVEINSILRSDESFALTSGSEHEFKKSGSRVFFDNLPIWLTRSDWTALAEIHVYSQTKSQEEVRGWFRVLHVYSADEQARLTQIFRRMFDAGTDPHIFLLMAPGDYEQAVRDNEWKPASLETEKFIHASPASQLNRVANKHYAQHSEIKLVTLVRERIRSEVRWEPATGGLYPHIYGPLNMDAVARVQSFSRRPDGTFQIAGLSAVEAGKTP